MLASLPCLVDYVLNYGVSSLRVWCSLAWCVQGLSNLLVEEDKVEEEITDVESELEVLVMQVRCRLTLLWLLSLPLLLSYIIQYITWWKSSRVIQRTFD